MGKIDDFYKITLTIPRQIIKYNKGLIQNGE